MKMLLRKKVKTNKYWNFIPWLDGGGQLFADIRFSQGDLESNTHEKRRMIVLQLVLLKVSEESRSESCFDV
jgi:hypothetical protein